MRNKRLVELSPADWDAVASALFEREASATGKGGPYYDMVSAQMHRIRKEISEAVNAPIIDLY